MLLCALLLNIACWVDCWLRSCAAHRASPEHGSADDLIRAGTWFGGSWVMGVLWWLALAAFVLAIRQQWRRRPRRIDLLVAVAVLQALVPIAAVVGDRLANPPL